MRLRVLPEIKCLRVEQATEIELQQLEISLTKQVEGWAFKKKYYAGWDGKVTFIKNGLIPLGLWKEVYDICQRFDYDLQIEGLSAFIDNSLTLEEFTAWVNQEFEGNALQPRDYQIETAWKILKYRACLGELATSAGKTLITFMVFAYMLKVKQFKKILMIVPNVQLVEQADGDFYEYNRSKIVDYEIQLIYSGKKIKKSSNIVVGTYQSLVKKDPEWFSQFDAVCVDEVHKAKAVSIKTILQKCRHTQYTFGVSGTIAKPGTLDRLTLMSQTGPVVQEVGTKFLIDKGHVTPVEIKVLKMNYAPDEVRQAFFQASRNADSQRIFKLEKDYIIENKDRLEFITNVITKTNKNSLILFHRTSYGKRIYNTLRQKNPGRQVFYVDGGTPTEVREEYKRRMEKGDDILLVASFGTFSTGVSIKKIFSIFFTESYKSEVIVRQSIGRGLRKHHEKTKLIIVDFTDDFSLKTNGKTYFENFVLRHMRKRIEIYNSINVPVQIKSVDL